MLTRTLDLSAYVGIPFVSRGREMTGADCWGLVYLVYARELGIMLPAYHEDYASDADRENVTRLVDGTRDVEWQRVAPGEEQPGDVALMRIFGNYHVGVAAGGSQLLHTSAPHGSRAEDYTGPNLRSRLQGFYRWRG